MIINTDHHIPFVHLAPENSPPKKVQPPPPPPPPPAQAQTQQKSAKSKQASGKKSFQTATSSNANQSVKVDIKTQPPKEEKKPMLPLEKKAEDPKVAPPPGASANNSLSLKQHSILNGKLNSNQSSAVIGSTLSVRNGSTLSKNASSCNNSVFSTGGLNADSHAGGSVVLSKQGSSHIQTSVIADGPDSKAQGSTLSLNAGSAHGSKIGSKTGQDRSSSRIALDARSSSDPNVSRIDSNLQASKATGSKIKVGSKFQTAKSKVNEKDANNSKVASNIVEEKGSNSKIGSKVDAKNSEKGSKIENGKNSRGPSSPIKDAKSKQAGSTMAASSKQASSGVDSKLDSKNG